MAKKGFAPPVTNFSISCDPSMVTWLNEYAHKNRISRSKIVRKALIDFRAEHQDALGDDNGPKIDPEERCVSCGARVIHNYGLAICMNDNKHCNIEALPGGGHRLKKVD
jgi:hypothetical protein